MPMNADDLPEEPHKSERQALYLMYRGMPAHPTTGKRMTQAAAAALAGVDATTVSRWRQKPQFRAQDDRVRREGIARAREQAKAGASALLGSAVWVLAALLRDKDAPPNVRASVAVKIMEWVGVAEPVQVEVGGDPWGALLKELAASGRGGDE
jgi:hypothetical protein